jgi:hypothetical protein
VCSGSHLTVMICSSGSSVTTWNTLSAALYTSSPGVKG